MEQVGSRRTNRAPGRSIAALAATATFVLVAGGLLGGLLDRWAPPAGAETGEAFDCAAPVADETGLLDVDVVIAAIDRVDGANVLVRGFDSVPGGDLPAAVDNIVAVCFDTQGSAFGDDLAVISFSVTERASDIFYGPVVSAQSDPAAVRESMSEPFAAGDFTGGVVAAVDDLAADLDADREAGAADGAESDAADGAEREAAVEEGGSDGNTLLPIAGVVAGLGVVGVGGLYAWRRRSLGELRAELERDVAAPRTRVGASREQGLRVEADADLWAKVSAGKTLTVLHEKRKAVRDAGKATEGAASLLGSATPDGIDRASAGQIAQARRRLVDLVAALDENELALARLLAFGAHIDHLRVALPAKRDLVLRELGAADKLADHRRAEGWNVDGAAAELATVRAVVQPLEFYDLALDHLTLSERIEAAEARLFAAEHDLQSVPDRPGSLATWRAEQARAAQAQEARSRTVEARLLELQAEHSPESWRWATSHPASARQLLVDGLATAATTEPLIAAQEFDDAGRVLDDAGMQLIAADALLDEVDDLIVDLEQAKIEAAGILAECRQVLGQFATFVRNHGGDLDEHLRAQPGLLDGTIDGLAAELTTERPNYLRVAETAEHINRELDGLLIEAEEQHQVMEALRRQAMREVARAQRNLRRARESLGWELFQSDDARAIERLAMALGQLPEALRPRIDVATRIADEAVLVQERIIARRRRNGNWIVVGGAHQSRGSWGSSSGSGGWGGGGWGGGSGSGGSRSFGGGGSRSFGGGRSSGSW